MEKENCGYEREHEEAVKWAKERMPNEENIERVCNTFRVIGEPSRMKIVLALLQGEMCVYHIVEACGGTQSAVSHQLRVLKDNRIIKSRRDGQNVLYSIADEHIVKIIQISEEHLNCKLEG